MQDGIYHVRFSSSVGGSGEGLVVLKQGSANGGDFGYLYTGQFNSDRESLSGRLNIKRWNPSSASVFGPLVDFDLQLTGKPNDDGGFTLSGGIAGQPGLTITIAGRYLAPAA